LVHQKAVDDVLQFSEIFSIQSTQTFAHKWYNKGFEY